MMRSPVRQQVYTLREVLTELKLRDSPSLGFRIDPELTGLTYRETAVIQDSHLTVEQMLAVPGLADTQWRYMRETHEWIPVFVAVDSEAVLGCVDMQPYFDLMMCEYFINVTPKDHPRDACDEIDYARNWAKGGDGYERIWQRSHLNEPLYVD